MPTRAHDSETAVAQVAAGLFHDPARIVFQVELGVGPSGRASDLPIVPRTWRGAAGGSGKESCHAVARVPAVRARRVNPEPPAASKRRDPGI